MKTELINLTKNQLDVIPNAINDFLEVAGIATARASFYNTLQETQEKFNQIHQKFISIDRGLYAAALFLPGVTDYTRQTGIRNLLRAPQNREKSMLSVSQEKTILSLLSNTLPPQRVLKLFKWIRDEKTNNSKTRKFILRYILRSKKLELWSLKYRRKLAVALTHAWGRRITSILQQIIKKPSLERSLIENKILQKYIGKYLDDKRISQTHVEECVGFIFGQKKNLTVQRFCAYHEAKRDINKGGGLPFEVLEGICSTYHKSVGFKKLMSVTGKLTQGQQITFQRKGEKNNIEITFDPENYDPIQLYRYAFERGLTEEIQRELLKKAHESTKHFPASFGYDHVGILLDTSQSMEGDKTQWNYPIASALAIRDALCAMSKKATIITSDLQETVAGELLTPCGETSLAEGLIRILKIGVEAVFILSDGYENAPAGRLNEIMHAVRNLGINTPVFLFSPVFAAETCGIRKFSDLIPAVPVRTIETITLSMLKLSLKQNLEKTIKDILSVAVLPGMISQSKNDERIYIDEGVRNEQFNNN